MLNKKLIISALLSLIFIIAGTAIADHSKNTIPAPIVAVIDVNYIYQHADALVNFRSDIETKRLKFQEEIAMLEKKLRKQEQQLIQKSNVGTEQRKKFEKGIEEVQKKLQMRKKQLEVAYESAMQKVRVVLMSIVAETADQRGINLIIPHSQTVFRDHRFDITKDILFNLNKKLPKVELVISDNSKNSARS
jgi:Skp family chaperone for outer membrane proteins